MVVFTIIGITIEFYTLLVKAFQRELYFGKQKRDHTLGHVLSINSKDKNSSKNFGALFHFYFSQNILLFDRYAQFSSQLEYLSSNPAELLWLAGFLD